MRRNAIGYLLLLAAGAAQSDDVIVLGYYERPPYMVRHGEGQAKGLTADPAAAAFRDAGIAFSWQLIPAKRQLEQIAYGKTLECGVGWYKTPEREKFGKFTAPIYRDKPTVALARSDFTSGEKTLATLVANPGVRVLMKSGLTYGQDVLRIMATAKANVQMITGEQPTLVRMVAANRADLMFSPQEEANMLLADIAAGANRLKLMAFTDVGEGNTRHILCSRKVSDETIARLNQAIAQSEKSGR